MSSELNMHLISASRLTPKLWYEENKPAGPPSRDLYEPSDYLLEKYTVKYFVMPGADAETMMGCYQDYYNRDQQTDKGNVHAILITLGGNNPDFDNWDPSDHMLDADITYYTIKQIFTYIHDNDILAADALRVRVELPPLDTFQVTTTTFRPFIQIYSNYMISPALTPRSTCVMVSMAPVSQLNDLCDRLL